MRWILHVRHFPSCGALQVLLVRHLASGCVTSSIPDSGIEPNPDSTRPKTSSLLALPRRLIGSREGRSPVKNTTILLPPGCHGHLHHRHVYAVAGKRFEHGKGRAVAARSNGDARVQGHRARTRSWPALGRAIGAQQVRFRNLAFGRQSHQTGVERPGVA